MLDSYQSGFERSIAFVGLSGDAKMRRERSVASSLMVKSKKHFPAFEALVSDSSFHDQLATAVRNPTGSTASDLMKVLKPVFELTNKHVPWSRGERKAEAGRITAVTRRFGPPTMMVTVSPNATDEPLVVCLAKRTLGADWKPLEVWRESATQMKARRALTEGAPASCVTFYNEFMNAVLTHLFGAELTERANWTQGVFGKAFLDVAGPRTAAAAPSHSRPQAARPGTPWPWCTWAATAREGLQAAHQPTKLAGRR